MCSCRLIQRLINNAGETHITALGYISGQAATQGPVIWGRVAVGHTGETDENRCCTFKPEL